MTVEAEACAQLMLHPAERRCFGCACSMNNGAPLAGVGFIHKSLALSFSCMALMSIDKGNPAHGNKNSEPTSTAPYVMHLMVKVSAELD